MKKSETLGRIILTKYCVITIALLAVSVVMIPTITGSGSALTFSQNISRDLADNLILGLTQILFVSGIIYLIGGLAGRWIIDKRYNVFVVGFLTLLVLWVTSFLSISITAAILNAAEYGIDGFASALTSWVIYGLVVFLGAGMFHGLSMGYFLGTEIRRKARGYPNS